MTILNGVDAARHRHGRHGRNLEPEQFRQLLLGEPLLRSGSDAAGNKSPTTSGSALVGTSGANTLTGTGGNELLYGGGGADTFSFASLSGKM